MPISTLFFSGVLAAVLLLASAVAAAVPAIQNWRTDNNVPVYFIPARELPMVDAQILFNAGSIHDGARPGLAMLTAALLEEGAGDWSADIIADRLDRVGARLGVSSRRDSAVISLRSLVDSRYLQPAVETVARLLKEPSFAPDAVERVRQQMLTGLQERAQSPGAIAQDAFFKALYGGHPYGSPPEGTTASLKGITRADIQGFHQRYYTSANAVIAIVGDLERPAAEQLAKALIGGLAKGEAIPLPPPAPPVSTNQTIRIPHPSSQTHILIGQIGVSRTDPDYYALYLGNHVLGGNGLVSQLSQEIRKNAASPTALTVPFSLRARQAHSLSTCKPAMIRRIPPSKSPKPPYANSPPTDLARRYWKKRARTLPAVSRSIWPVIASWPVLWGSSHSMGCRWIIYKTIFPP